MEKIALEEYGEACVLVSAEDTNRQYMVQCQCDDMQYALRLRADEIVARKDMSDCTGEELLVYDVSVYGKVEKLTLRGPWGDFKNPLKIWAENTRGEVVFEGYGTDH